LFRNGKHYSCFESELSDFKCVHPSPPFLFASPLHPCCFSDRLFSTPSPSTALLTFIERRSPKAKRVSNPSEKRSQTQGTVTAGWGKVACVGRTGQHMQDSCWHQRENIWQPPAFILRHVNNKQRLLNVTLSPCLRISLPAALWLPRVCLLFSINISHRQRLLQPQTFLPTSCLHRLRSGTLLTPGALCCLHHLLHRITE